MFEILDASGSIACVCVDGWATFPMLRLADTLRFGRSFFVHDNVDFFVMDFSKYLSIRIPESSRPTAPAVGG